ncbi:MAG: DNA polymerase III subunit gamma/tau, partial [Actinomyces sp.]
MAYQSLYRRFRPRRFAEIKGQPHVVAALQGAVREGTVGHAYLLHGPRGTGKTTTARVLAKALNCENRGDDGEPCCVCESCVAIEEGRSFDLHELDAASNNRVENMRELLQRVNLGTPGRAKVYLLDEVHMLTSGAENALLKTLEEPPAHVTWVLATTEPHKVVETIRSRCQVFELRLLGGDAMAEHVRWVIAEAGLDIPADRLDEVVDHVVAEGGGSVRDTLSALDRVVAAGGVVDLDTSTDTLLEALVAGDVAGALAGVAAALDRGRDPRTLGADVLAGLRDAFLTAMGAPPARLSERARRRAETLAGAVAPRVLTRAVEVLGSALVDMRQAPDPRIDLEVALVRLCGVADADPGAGGGVDEGALAALVRRVETLEGRLAALAESSPGPGRARGGESHRDRAPSAPPPPAVPSRRPARTTAAPAAPPAPP